MCHPKFLLHLLRVSNNKLINLLKVINHKHHSVLVINMEFTYKGKRYVITQGFMGSQPRSSTQ